MSGWTLFDTHPTQGRTFQRSLDVYELGFLWDGLFNGTAVNLHHFELHLLNGSQDAHLFSDANIVRAWVSTKRRYPLSGATVQDSGTGFASEPHFVVRDHDLAVLCPREIVFGRVTCAEDAHRQVAAILDGLRPLSEELLVHLYVFRETDSERTNVLHLMVLMAHCITDGVVNRTLVRCLLDTLARGGGSEAAQSPLEERLAMAVPSMDHEPWYLRSLSPAIRGWRKAVRMLIFQLKMAKRQNGHTLPCRLTRLTPHVAGRTCLVSIAHPNRQLLTVVCTI
ncbi:hypothetical protein OG21DRAFT_617841 [Imleria badia]|nr:hypothetical protein OG21DRAFT_617841 [Imleria badia]